MDVDGGLRGRVLLFPMLAHRSSGYLTADLRRVEIEQLYIPFWRCCWRWSRSVVEGWRRVGKFEEMSWFWHRKTLCAV